MLTKPNPNEMLLKPNEYQISVGSNLQITSEQYFKNGTIIIEIKPIKGHASNVVE